MTSLRLTTMMMESVEPKTIHITGLSQSCNEEILISAFQAFGELVEVHLPRNVGTIRQHNEQSNPVGQHKGFAFITFSNADEADNAIDNMNLNIIQNQVINVTIAKSQNNSMNLDAKKPIWQTEEWIQQYGNRDEENPQAMQAEE